MLPSSSAATSSSTRSTLTASSNRWWKKQGVCRKRAAKDGGGFGPSSELRSWRRLSCEVLDARVRSILLCGEMDVVGFIPAPRNAFGDGTLRGGDDGGSLRISCRGFPVFAVGVRL